MASILANPYANLELRVPAADHDSFRKLTTTFRPEDGSKPDIDRSPFDRYVDLWWTALCVGIRESRMTTGIESTTFVTGVVFNQDPWRITQLELLALAETEDPSVLEDPGKVIAIANAYAFTGAPILIDTMTGATPIWAVTDYLLELVNRA